MIPAPGEKMGGQGVGGKQGDQPAGKTSEETQGRRGTEVHDRWVGGQIGRKVGR